MITAEEKEKFVKENFNTMSDIQMSEVLKISPRQIQTYRLRYQSRRQSSLKSKENIAIATELFANGISMVEIGRRFNVHSSTISTLMSKVFFYKKRSFDTITVVAESKINYN